MQNILEKQINENPLITSQKKIIGRTEKIILPDLQLTGIEAKVDTGAFSCALHCSKVEILEKKGKKSLRFVLLDPEHPAFNNKDFYFEQYEKRKVKNSFGQSEERYVIQTPIFLFNESILTDFTLCDRGNMKFPVLLGRKFLNDKFLVDVSLKNVSS